MVSRISLTKGEGGGGRLFRWRSDKTSNLYGGSGKPQNAVDLFSQEDIDGGLIGGASLDEDDFVSIINSF